MLFSHRYKRQKQLNLSYTLNYVYPTVPEPFQRLTRLDSGSHTYACIIFSLHNELLKGIINFELQVISRD